MKRFLIATYIIIACVIVLLSIRAATGQAVKQTSISPTKENILKSTVNGKEYQLYISLPSKYNPADTLRYPVLYVLDGIYAFPIVAGTRNVLELGNEIEDIIIVAIGDIRSGTYWINSRTFDYTPSCDTRYDSINSKDHWFFQNNLKSGGAKAFLGTIQNDIIPFIDKNYKTTADRGITGHSLGGLFAGYCLLTAPGLFTRYGINSPSFWWNNKEILGVENSFIQNHSRLNAKVFISVGSLEQEMMLTDMVSFTNIIKKPGYKDLILTSQIFDNETHLSAMPVSLNRTLRVLYGTKPR